MSLISKANLPGVRLFHFSFTAIFSLTLFIPFESGFLTFSLTWGLHLNCGSPFASSNWANFFKHRHVFPVWSFFPLLFAHLYEGKMGRAGDCLKGSIRWLLFQRFRGNFFQRLSFSTISKLYERMTNPFRFLLFLSGVLSHCVEWGRNRYFNSLPKHLFSELPRKAWSWLERCSFPLTGRLWVKRQLWSPPCTQHGSPQFLPRAELFLPKICLMAHLPLWGCLCHWLSFIFLPSTHHHLTHYIYLQDHLFIAPPRPFTQTS